MRRFTMIVVTLLVLGGAAAAQWRPSDRAPYQPGPDTCATLATEFWKPCPGRQPDRRIPFQWLPGYVVAGRLDANPAIPDFGLMMENRYWGSSRAGDSDGTPKLRVRSLVVRDLGDTPDIQLGAAGPDRGPYNGPAEAFQWKGSTTGIGKIYGQVLAPDCRGQLDWVAGCGNFGRTAVIEFALEGHPTGTSRPGSIRFYTTPDGSANEVYRGAFEKTGQFVVQTRGSAGLPTIAVPCGSQNCGIWGDANGVQFSVRGPGSTSVDAGGFALPDRDGGTSLTLVRRTGNDVTTVPVTEGPPDSCGAGYRCLRIPN